jgi:hypothetical protein
VRQLLGEIAKGRLVRQHGARHAQALWERHRDAVAGERDRAALDGGAVQQHARHHRRDVLVGLRDHEHARPADAREARAQEHPPASGQVVEHARLETRIERADGLVGRSRDGEAPALLVQLDAAAGHVRAVAAHVPGGRVLVGRVRDEGEPRAQGGRSGVELDRVREQPERERVGCAVYRIRPFAESSSRQVRVSSRGGASSSNSRPSSAAIAAASRVPSHRPKITDAVRFR